MQNGTEYNQIHLYAGYNSAQNMSLGSNELSKILMMFILQEVQKNERAFCNRFVSVRYTNLKSENDALAKMIFSDADM